jgi:hypothetical protein
MSKKKESEKEALKKAKINLLTVITNTRTDSLSEHEMDLYTVLNEDPDIIAYIGEGIDELMEG